MAGQQAVVMIDSGATYNFISTYAVTKLGMSRGNSKAFEVTLGIWKRVPKHVFGAFFVFFLFM